MTPIARTADLLIPVRPGGDLAVFNGRLQILIERGWIDAGVHRRARERGAEVEEVVKKYNAGRRDHADRLGKSPHPWTSARINDRASTGGGCPARRSAWSRPAGVYF